MRSPRRTAQTASALMIGIALVSAMAVFGASVSRSATSSVDDAISADVIVSGTSNGSGSFSRSLADAVTRVPGVRASLIAYGGQFEVRQSLETLKGVSTRGLSETVILRMTAGSVGALAAGDLLIDSTTAKSDHLDVGSTVPVKFALTGSTRMRIGGIYKANALIGSYVVSQAFYLSHYQDPLPGAVLLKTASSSAAEREVNRLLAPYPTVQVQTRAQFDKSQVSSVNQLLGLIYALLALAVVHRPGRYRQHADAVGVRAHPRDRPAPRRGHETAPGADHGPHGVGDPVGLRCRHRHRRRDRHGHSPGELAQAHRHGRAYVEPHRVLVPLGRARPGGRHLAGPPGGQAGRPGRHRRRVGVRPEPL